MHHKLSTRGFSLMELLAVIAVMALLAALIIPSLTSMMDKGRSMQCAANLRNVAITAFNFSADYDGRIPGLESIHAGPGFATENPNGLSFVQELHIYEYGARNIAYGDSPDTLAKLPHYICPENKKSVAVSPNDLRRVSYKPPRAPWLRTALWRFGEPYAGHPNLINGMEPANYMLKPNNIPLVTGYGLSDVVMLGEGEVSNEGRIRRNTPVLRTRDPDGNPIMDYNVRLSHNRKRGKNYLYFDGHARLDPDYVENFDQAISMKEWGTDFYLSH